MYVPLCVLNVVINKMEINASLVNFQEFQYMIEIVMENYQNTGCVNAPKVLMKIVTDISVLNVILTAKVALVIQSVKNVLISANNKQKIVNLI